MNNSKKIAEALIEARAFKISLDPLFTWTSGLKSPVYCDLRSLISVLDVRKLIVSSFVEMIQAEGEIDVIAGTATAGIPWAAWIAEELNLPMVYVRGEAKGHGTKKRIEGLMDLGAKVALIEDHISTGKSSVSAVNALRDEGAEVNTIFAINTYELRAADSAFDSAKIKVKTITNYSEILQVSSERGDLDSEKMDVLVDFREDPAGWAEKHGF